MEEGHVEGDDGYSITQLSGKFTFYSICFVCHTDSDSDCLIGCVAQPACECLLFSILLYSVCLYYAIQMQTEKSHSFLVTVDLFGSNLSMPFFLLIVYTSPVYVAYVCMDVWQ
jgi:hypothetical protein